MTRDTQAGEAAPKDHGGDLDRAMAAFGPGDWIDLSTGINPVPYPMPPLEAGCLGRLPTGAETAGLERAAQTAYGTDAPCVALPGAQGAIQIVPRLADGGKARVIGPTYNEHAGALRNHQGWEVEEVGALSDLGGADLAIVVNPNNPDGRLHSPGGLRDLSCDVGLLVVDESFGDVTPEASCLPGLSGAGNVLVLRSFGKFYGLAGLRLGFAFGPADLVAQARALAGPWAVSGPAIAAGRVALADRRWRDETRARLARDSARLDDLAARAGWALVGGTTLFRTYVTPDAAAAQRRLARAHIWSRIFPYSPTWLRLGLPGSAAHWDRLEAALAP